jgi:hypothetical protein
VRTRWIRLAVLTVLASLAMGTGVAQAASTAATETGWMTNQNGVVEFSNAVRVAWNYNGLAVSNGFCTWTVPRKVSFWTIVSRSHFCRYENGHTVVHGSQTVVFRTRQFCGGAVTTAAIRVDTYGRSNGSARGTATFAKSGGCTGSLFGHSAIRRGLRP